MKKNNEDRIKSLINAIGLFLSCIVVIFFIAKEIVRSNPCSAWADNPSECSSNHFEDIK